MTPAATVDGPTGKTRDDAEVRPPPWVWDVVGPAHAPTERCRHQPPVESGARTSAPAFRR
ncbi:hypothetical protein C1701_21185 [Actinoalloteichus sp. AHMU CJ021]|nr:hypothetical protein C1701_21185 [Actinoalloteichus sp. AHMU CJ021]